MKRFEAKYVVPIALWLAAMAYNYSHLGFARGLARLSLFSLVLLAYVGVSALVLKYGFGIKEVRSKIKILLFSGRRGPVPLGTIPILVSSMSALTVVVFFLWLFLAR